MSTTIVPDQPSSAAGNLKAVHLSEEWFQLWSEAGFDGIALHEDGVILDANGAMAAMFGCALPEFVGRQILEFAAPESRARMVENVSAGHDRPYEAFGLRKGGTKFPMEICGKSFLRDGRRLRLTIIRDVTERKRAEDALRASKERYRMLAELAPDMIYVVNRDDVVEYVNPLGAGQLGRRPEEIIGQPRALFFPAATNERHRQSLRKVFESGEPLHVETSAPFPAGTLWLDVWLVPIKDAAGGVTKVLGLSRDITRHKQTEEAVRASEARYRTLAEAAHDMIFIIGRDGAVQYVNSFAASHLGLRPEDIIGKPRAQFFQGAESDQQAQALRAVFERSEPAYTESLTSFPKAQLWLGTWLVPMRNEAGQVGAVMGISRDITERKRAEEALRQSEERYRLLIESAHDAIFMADAETGLIVEANQQAEKLLGLPREKLVGLHQARLHPPEEADRYRQVFQRHLETGSAITDNLVVRRSDGRDVPVDISANVIQLGQRRIIHGSFRDATERRRAEETLRLQSAALESAANGIVITDRAGEVVWVNPAFTRLTGYAAEEIVGQNIRLLKSGQHGPEYYRELWQTILAGKVWQSEVVNRRKDGGLFTQEQTITPVRDQRGQISHFIAIQQDVTERRRMETELRESRERFERIFLSSPESITISSVEDYRFLEVNDGFLAPLGYTREEVIGRTPLELGLYADLKDRDRAVNCLRQDGRLRNFECRFSGKNGETFDALVSSEPIQLGSEPCLLSVVNNVTRWKQQQAEMEEKLRRSQKLESIGTLAGGVAHDFNNLLTVIQGHTGLVLAEAALPPACRDSLQQIGQAADRAANLTRQLLTFSRKQPLRRQAVDLNEVVGNLTRMLRRIIGEDIALEIKCAPKLPPVLADTGMMEQVIMNLAVNARDAIHARQPLPETGTLIIGTATIMASPPTLADQEDRAFEAYVCLTLQDNGCGIPPEIRERIYDPFFTTKEAGQGTGLGLATVHGIVEEHGGWIHFDSRVNEGTTFRIHLPALRRENAGPAEVQRIPQVRGGQETILLVEDEQELRELTQEVLRRYGYGVFTARSGREALTVWEQHGSKIDLLLTDVVMPDGIGGRQLAEQLDTHRPGLKVIFTTGYSPDVTGWDFMRGDGVYYLQKPYPPHELAQVVRNCLDGVTA